MRNSKFFVALILSLIPVLASGVTLDVPYVPTPQPVVERMLQLAEIKRGETVVDLGSGDGRIVITAAKKYGAKGIGIDLDADRVKEARENVKKDGLSKLVTIIEGDVLKVNLPSADVVTLYLLPGVNLNLRSKLRRLPVGTRIVSHDFDMGDWKPLRHETLTLNGKIHQIYLWRVGFGHGPTVDL